MKKIIAVALACAAVFAGIALLHPMQPQPLTIALPAAPSQQAMN